MPSLSSACLMSCDCSMVKCFKGMTTCLRFLTHVELLELNFKFCRPKELLTSDLSLELPIFLNLKNVTCFLYVFLFPNGNLYPKKFAKFEEGCNTTKNVGLKVKRELVQMS